MTICRSSDVQRTTDRIHCGSLRRLHAASVRSCRVPLSSAVGFAAVQCTTNGLTPVDCLGQPADCEPEDDTRKTNPTTTIHSWHSRVRNAACHTICFSMQILMHYHQASLWYNWHYRSDASDAVEDDYAMQLSMLGLQQCRGLRGLGKLLDHPV